MCRLIEEYGEKVAKRVREETARETEVKATKKAQKEFASKLLLKKIFSYEEISELTNLSVAEIKRLEKKQSTASNVQ